MDKLNRHEQTFLDEVNQYNDNRFANVISLLNTHNNFKELYKDKIDLEKVLPYLCKEALNRNIRIDTKGYIDLLPIIKEVK